MLEHPIEASNPCSMARRLRTGRPSLRLALCVLLATFLLVAQVSVARGGGGGGGGRGGGGGGRGGGGGGFDSSGSASGDYCFIIPIAAIALQLLFC